MKINLGCGNNYIEGYVNCDISHEVQADKYFSAFETWPFANNDADEILAEKVIQQIPTPQQLVFSLNEMWRVLKPHGEATIVVPASPFPNAFQDPMDVLYFTRETFDYLNEENRRWKLYGKTYGLKPWRVNLIKQELRGENWAMLTAYLSPKK